MMKRPRESDETLEKLTKKVGKPFYFAQKIFDYILHTPVVISMLGSGEAVVKQVLRGRPPKQFALTVLLKIYPSQNIQVKSKYALGVHLIFWFLEMVTIIVKGY